MRFAYLDESRTSDGRIYMFGILLIDEHQLSSIERSLDSQASFAHSLCPSVPDSAEFHGYDLFHLKSDWNGAPIWLSVQLFQNISKIVVNSGATLIIRAINVPRLKARYSKPFPPHELALAHAFEAIERKMRETAPDEAVLLFADEHHSAETGRTNLHVGRDRKLRGKTSITLDHIADTVYFGPSSSSRLLQAIDVVTFVFQRHRFHTERDPQAQRALNRIWRILGPAITYHEWP